MNQDIVYEILRHLHHLSAIKPEENGGALLAKKLMLSLDKK